MFRDGLSLPYISIQNVKKKKKDAINHYELWLLTLEIPTTKIKWNFNEENRLEEKQDLR